MVVSLALTLILPSYCVKAQWVTSCLICSTINGTELPSDFSHFWQIWGRTSSWFIKTFQLTAFPVREKKKPEEFGTRQLFFTIHFYFFKSYQMQSLDDVWGQDQQLLALVHELHNQWFILLWGGLESSLATSKLSPHCCISLQTDLAQSNCTVVPVLQEETADTMLCQGGELHYLW